MIVVDASVVLEVLLGTPIGRGLEFRLRVSGESLHAPGLIDVEVVQILRRLDRLGDLSARRGGEAVSDLIDLPVRRYPHLPFTRRIWQLRANLTAYDAAYVALAEELGAALITRDARLARSRGHRAEIELV